MATAAADTGIADADKSKPPNKTNNQREKNLKLLAITAALATLSAPAWAINKCTGPDGKVAYQEAPCAGRGEAVKVWVSPGQAPSNPEPDKPVAPAAPASAPSAAPAPAPAPKTPVKSALEQEADTCLSWYKPLLRDPAGAYYTQPSKQGRVVSITLHGTNGYGGYVTKDAACEILNGQLNQNWTKIHAGRRGWSVN